MTTDDERRAVARRLRRSRSEWSGMGWRLWLGPKFCAVVLSDGNRDELEDAAHRLADLIDPDESGQNQDTNPDTVQKESPAVQKAPECDRDALLALAEEMVEAFRLGAFTGEGLDAKWCRELHDKYARRIREACGEGER